MFITLMYHLVDDEIVSPMSIKRHTFEQQMKYLMESNVNVMSQKNVIDCLNGTAPPLDGVFVTFDDGYMNTIDVALPILKKYSIPATMSICSSYIVESEVPLDTIHESNEFAKIDDIKLWLSEGMDIAGHTYSHPDLTKLVENDFKSEIFDDKEYIENIFNRSLPVFFYPFGKKNGRVEAYIRSLYEYSFLTDEGDIPSIEDKHNIRRLEVSPSWDLDQFIKNVNKELEQVK